MTIRIYALSKQLKKTSKEIIDACQKIGINASSSLQNLSDEDVEKITKFFSGEEEQAAKGSNVPEMVQPASIASNPSKKVRSIPDFKPRPNGFARFFTSSANKKTTDPGSPAVSTSEEAVSEKTDSGNLASVSTDSISAANACDVSKKTPIKGSNADSVEPVEVGTSLGIDVVTEQKVAEVVETVVEAQVEIKAVEENASVEPEQKEAKSGEIVEAVLSAVSDEAIKSVESAPVAGKNEETKAEIVSAPIEVVVPSVESVEQKSAPEGGSGEKETVETAEPVVVEQKTEEKPSVEEKVVDDKVKESDGGSKKTDVAESISGIEQQKKDAMKSTAEKVPQSAQITSVPVSSSKSSNSGNVQGASNTQANGGSKKSAPLASVINRGKGRGDNRGDQRFDRNDKRNNQSVNKPVDSRPVRPSLPAYAQPDRAAIEEMKRPPMITPPSGARIQVLGSNPRRSLDSNNSSSGSKSSSKSNVAIHLAPMPTAVRPAAKKPVENAQKPVRPYDPEKFQKPVGPLSHLVAGKGRGKTADGAGPDKRNANESSRGNDSKDKGLRGNRSFAGSGQSQSLREQPLSSEINARGKKGGHSGDHGDMEGQDARKRSNAQAKRRGNNKFINQDDDDFGYSSRVGRARKANKAAVVTAPRVSDIVIETPCTVKGFSEATGKSVAEVIKALMKLGMMMTMNQTVEYEVLELLIMEFDLKATIKQPASLEEQFVDSVYEEVDPPEALVARAPVVTFLGHVDHGKTSLLDRILHLHVVSGEKGGITQHIRAYRVNTPGGAVTFVDTPGHEAFTEMRARGANCTDIAVLVVAADDGVMPQTEEAISHAKAAGVPIVVALNKMDLPGVNRDKVIQELASNDLMPSEWGGDVEIVETSAVTGKGVDVLLDTLLTVAELKELKANPNRRANGVVLEASLESGEGVVCKALVQNGTLKNGDVVLCGSSYGRVRSMSDTLDSHKRIKEAGPSVPVSLVGLDVAPNAGSKFVVLDDISVARQIAEERSKRAREVQLAGTPSHVTLESLFERINSAKTQQTLNVIIRADVRGSIEAICKELGKLEHPEVKVKILQASVGGITEADVHLADASDAIIVGFNVVPDEGARDLAETKKVQVRRYDIIYKLSEDIKAALEGMLKPIERVKELGRAQVQRTFNISRVGVIAGCRVVYGVIERDCQIRVIRNSRIIGEYSLDTLKREKDDAKEVREGYECGIKLKNYNDVKEGDTLEAYKIEEVARTFEE